MGDRAQDFAGYDLVSKRTVHLEDYLGKWVLVDFWAAWCGPCCQELPSLLKQARPYRDRGELAVLSVSCDTPDTLAALKQKIRQLSVDFPVLYDGGGADSQPAKQWNISSWPSTLLVNPQGVVVARDIEGSVAGAQLAFYLEHPQPVIGLRASYRANQDGTFSVYADAMNPARTPLPLSLTLLWEKWQWPKDDPTRTVTTASQGWKRHYADCILQFDEFGEAHHEFLISPDKDMDAIGYDVVLAIPGGKGVGSSEVPDLFSWVRKSEIVLSETTTDSAGRTHVQRRWWEPKSSAGRS